MISSIVLVHGAWHDASCWDRVVPLLEDEGITVHCPTIRGLEPDFTGAPCHLDPCEAATLPVAALTAWHTLFSLGGLQAGMTLLVQGVGGVSSFACQFGKLAGSRVITLVRSDASVNIARGLGADEVVLEPNPMHWSKAVRRLAPDGVDRVFDISGSGISQSIACCRGDAMVHLVGYTGGTTTSLDLFMAIRHAVTLRAASAGHRASFELMARAMERASIRPLIGACFGRDQFGDALADLGRKGRSGKIALDFSTNRRSQPHAMDRITCR